MWMVVGYYMADPTERVIGESWERITQRLRLKMLSTYKEPAPIPTNMLLRDSDEK